MNIIDNRKNDKSTQFNMLSVGSLFRLASPQSGIYLKTYLYIVGSTNCNTYNLSENYALSLNAEAKTFPVNGKLVIED